MSAKYCALCRTLGLTHVNTRMCAHAGTHTHTHTHTRAYTHAPTHTSTNTATYIEGHPRCGEVLAGCARVIAGIVAHAVITHVVIVVVRTVVHIAVVLIVVPSGVFVPAAEPNNLVCED